MKLQPTLRLGTGQRLRIPGCKLATLFLAGSLSFLAAAVLAAGQVPGTLLHLLPNPLDPLASFGHSVAISGSRLVVGGCDDVSSNSCAFVYDLTSPTPNVLALTLTYPNQEAGDSFGYSVGISGARVAVGCPGSGQGTNLAGRVFLYDLTSPTPTVPVFTFTNVNLALQESALGVSVAVSDRWLVAGAGQGSIDNLSSGSVHVFDLTSATPSIPTMVLTNPGPAGSSAFGYSLAMAGSRVVAGSPGDLTGASGSGCAYVYDLTGANPTQPFVVLSNPTPSFNANFGRSVAICGDRVVTGAGWDDTAGFDAGIAYVYDLESATPSAPALTLTNPSPASGDRFGAGVATSGDLVVVGAYGNDTGTNGAGIVYVFDLTRATPTLPAASLPNPQPMQFASMGRVVAVEGVTLIAAPGVYVYGPKPTLNLVRTASNLATLSWTPATSSGFALQFSDRLPPTNWFDAPSGATNPVMIATTNSARFYRLFKP